jgi:hypothetical protein
MEPSTQPPQRVVLSPGVLVQRTSSQESTTSATLGIAGRKLDVDRDSIVRLMHYCHDQVSDAIRSGNNYSRNFWDGALWFGRHCFEMERE